MSTIDVKCNKFRKHTYRRSIVKEELLVYQMLNRRPQIRTIKRSSGVPWGGEEVRGYFSQYLTYFFFLFNKKDVQKTTFLQLFYVLSIHLVNLRLSKNIFLLLPHSSARRRREANISSPLHSSKFSVPRNDFIDKKYKS